MAVIEAALQPGGKGHIRAEVLALIGVLPSPTTDCGSPEEKASLYCAVLADLPTWAVKEAVAAALRGKIGNYRGRYLPAPGEIHGAAERYLECYWKELSSIKKVLTAEIRPDIPESQLEATRQRVKELAAQTIKALSAARSKGERNVAGEF